MHCSHVDFQSELVDELRNKLKEKTEELKSVKANSKEQLEAINKLLEEHEENMGKVGKVEHTIQVLIYFGGLPLIISEGSHGADFRDLFFFFFFFFFTFAVHSFYFSVSIFPLCFGCFAPPTRIVNGQPLSW